MKITKVTMKNGEMQMPVTTDLRAVVERMNNKNTLNMSGPLTLIFAATFGRGGFDDVRQLTGLLLMTAEAESDQRIAQWQQRVMQIPYTLLAFRSRSRRQLHVVVRITPADGHEVTATDEYQMLMQQAYQQVTAVYRSLATCEFQKQEVRLDAGCLLSYDPLVCLHDEAQPFPVMLTALDPLSPYRHVVAEADGSVYDCPAYEELERMKREYYTCLSHALDDYPDEGDEEQALNALAGYCRKAQLDEEASVRRTLWHWRFHEHEDIARKIFRAAYATNYQGKPISQMNQKERIAHTIRDFFERRYQLRFNVVKQVAEYRPNDQTFQQWKPLDDRELKRIAFEEMLEGGEGWMIDIELYVNSSLVVRYNPIHEFLAGVGRWDQKNNYIEDYARRLKTDYDRWPHFFHRWLLAMVAQALNKNRDFGNSMVPLLIGTQAMKKSTFCKNILPYALREYYMDDIKMDNAEQVERVLGRMWLVNIDEYNAKTEREQAKIKRLLTEKDVQIRKMRSDQYTMTPRLCSFIATTNDRQPLMDPTGSRRYLCIEMTGQADMSGTINYRQMYAQAVWEVKHGEQYWFDNDDEREITEHNAKYLMRTSVEEALATLYAPADKERSHFMTTTDIQQQLRSHLLTADVPTLAKLGRALKRMHFPEGAQDGIRGYYLRSRKSTSV
jgi:hypothetical protein